MQHEPIPWDEPGVFPAGTYVLPRLIELSHQVHGAIFIFGEDDKLWYRRDRVKATRDNVLLEYGIFAATLGPERALICRKGEAKKPSNLDGLLHLQVPAGHLTARGPRSARAQLVSWIRGLEGQGSSRTAFNEEFVQIAADNRSSLDDEYRKRKYGAHQLDILGIALAGALTELATDRDDKLIRRVLSHGAQVRMLLLSPRSEYVERRALEDGDSAKELRELLQRSVKSAVKVYDRLQRAYRHPRVAIRQEAAIGSLEIRVIDACPHCTIYRTDDTMLWGIYSAATRGFHSAVLRVQLSQRALFEQLRQHFESLWNSTTTRALWLVKCSRQNPPKLNAPLVAELLAPQPDKASSLCVDRARRRTPIQ
jgi:hypothetical protein